MTFTQPLFLLGLIAVPVLLALYLLAQKRRRRYVMRFTDVSLLASVVGRTPGWRRHVPPVLFLLAAAGTKPANRIVLLTDGVSNHGIEPLVAAASAKAAGIPVYTIGIGSRNADVVVKGQPVGGVDEQGLSAVAATTGGKYFFAQEATQLNQIYSELGTQFGWRLVKFDITIPVLILGTIMVLAAATLSLVWFRVLP
jgi:hypothetical protein